MTFKRSWKEVREAAVQVSGEVCPRQKEHLCQDLKAGAHGSSGGNIGGQ